MSLKIKIHCATQDEESFVISQLKMHTQEVGGVNTKSEPFSVAAFEDTKLVGAVIGKVFWNWLYADLVWVDAGCRGKGIGKAMMEYAEQKAKEMRLTGIYLWTESWQAPYFYPKIGFEKYAEFEDFPPGHRRFGFRKYIE